LTTTRGRRPRGILLSARPRCMSRDDHRQPCTDQPTTRQPVTRAAAGRRRQRPPARARPAHDTTSPVSPDADHPGRPSREQAVRPAEMRRLAVALRETARRLRPTAPSSRPSSTTSPPDSPSAESSARSAPPKPSCPGMGASGRARSDPWPSSKAAHLLSDRHCRDSYVRVGVSWSHTWSELLSTGF
jgi:hypothetical protein